jgi:hypothetical protein
MLTELIFRRYPVRLLLTSCWLRNLFGDERKLLEAKNVGTRSIFLVS